VRAGLRWLAATAAGVAAFEGLDLIGSSPGIVARVPGLMWLPAISPFLAGMIAGGATTRGAVLALLAAASVAWVRIGVDRGIGLLRGAHLPPESGAVLIVAFGLPWTVMALLGGGSAVFVRRLRRHGPRRGS